MPEMGEGSADALAIRMDNLEMRIAYQDEVIEALNKTVVEQWGKIDEALARIKLLEVRIREIGDSSGRDAYDEPPPPHY
jgi:SlyX protein